MSPTDYERAKKEALQYHMDQIGWYMLLAYLAGGRGKDLQI